MHRTLVIVIAETRAHALTWNKFQQNQLRPLNADLALCVRNDEPENEFYRHAKYVSTHPEPSDWGDLYTGICGNDHWRNLLTIPGNWLGGAGPAGSGAILIAYRWFLLQWLTSHAVEYDQYIVTRSDHYNLWPHPVLDVESVWVPEGEDSGGLCDRHIVFPRRLMESCLGLMGRIISDPEALRREMMLKGRHEWNLEQFLAFTVQERGIEVKRFQRTMFAVKGENDSTRWSRGQFDERVGMIVKYPSELDMCLQNAPHSL